MSSRSCARVLVALAIIGTWLGACSAAVDAIAVGEATVVTWPGPDGTTLGQVIVSIRNVGEGPIDPDVLGRGRLTQAHLLDADDSDLPGGDARVQLHAVPSVLGPGEAGYLIGDFAVAEPPDGVGGARVEVNSAAAELPTPVTVEDFELVDGPDGVGAQGRLDWDGEGTAVARAIALDADGRAVGYLATSEVLYAPGEFTMCCLPPVVDAAEIDDVAVFGIQARDREGE